MVEAQTGTLVFETWKATNSGRFQVATNAAIRFFRVYLTTLPGAYMGGEGEIQMREGSFILNHSYTNDARLELSVNSLTGTGSFCNADVAR